MKKAFRNICICFIVIMGSLLGGCSEENLIEVPFSYDEVEAREYREVESELVELGFTNISLETIGWNPMVYEEDCVGTVAGVYFDENNEFINGDEFKKYNILFM